MRIENRNVLDHSYLLLIRGSALYSCKRDALDDLLLHSQEKHYRRQDKDHSVCKYAVPLGSILVHEIVYTCSQGPHFRFHIECHRIGKVIPCHHESEAGGGDDSRLRYGKRDPDERRERIASINLG